MPRRRDAAPPGHRDTAEDVAYRILATTRPGLGCARRHNSRACILVEAKAHIPEAASPPSKASEASLALIRQSLDKARRFYAPRSKADWSSTFYQYANRLAIQYFLAKINGVKSRIVFLDFCNATDMDGPETEAEWRGATRLIHAQLGLPADLTSFGVFHAYVDVRHLTDLV